MTRTMSEFTGKYKLSQTLKFELQPVGATEQRLQESKLLEQDFKRAEDYPKCPGQPKNFYCCRSITVVCVSDVQDNQKISTVVDRAENRVHRSPGQPKNYYCCR